MGTRTENGVVRASDPGEWRGSRDRTVLAGTWSKDQQGSGRKAPTKIIIDTNRIIAALIADGTTREIIKDKRFLFFSPEIVLKELDRHAAEISRRSQAAFSTYERIRKRVILIPEELYIRHLQTAELADRDDRPFLAAAIAIAADGIWTHDKHLLEQGKIRTFTNIDMLKRH